MTGVRADVLDLACDYAALREAVDRALVGVGCIPPDDPLRAVEVLAGIAVGVFIGDTPVRPA